MNDKVVKIYPPGAAKDPDAVLEQAAGEYESVLIIGWDKEGMLSVRSTTDLNGRDGLWMIEQFKLSLLGGDYSD